MLFGVSSSACGHPFCWPATSNILVDLCFSTTTHDEGHTQPDKWNFSDSPACLELMGKT